MSMRSSVGSAPSARSVALTPGASACDVMKASALAPRSRSLGDDDRARCMATLFSRPGPPTRVITSSWAVINPSMAAAASVVHSTVATSPPSVAHASSASKNPRSKSVRLAAVDRAHTFHAAEMATRRATDVRVDGGRRATRTRCVATTRRVSAASSAALALAAFAASSAAATAFSAAKKSSSASWDFIGGASPASSILRISSIFASASAASARRRSTSRSSAVGPSRVGRPRVSVSAAASSGDGVLARGTVQYVPSRASNTSPCANAGSRSPQHRTHTAATLNSSATTHGASVASPSVAFDAASTSEAPAATISLTTVLDVASMARRPS